MFVQETGDGCRYPLQTCRYVFLECSGVGAPTTPTSPVTISTTVPPGHPCHYNLITSLLRPRTERSVCENLLTTCHVWEGLGLTSGSDCSAVYFGTPEIVDIEIPYIVFVHRLVKGVYILLLLWKVNFSILP